MRTIDDMSEEQLEQDEDSKKIFVWYYDVFLPAAVANPHQYGPTVRHYKEYVDKVTVHKQQRVAVSPYVEAFGLLIYDNCVDKWNFQYQQKEAHPNGKIDAQCKQNRGKYTYIAKGQQGNKDRSEAVCGFTKAGQQKLIELVEFTKNRRFLDAQDGTKKAKLALKLMKEKHNINQEAAAPTKPTNKKRRVTKVAPSQPPAELLADDEEF